MVNQVTLRHYREKKAKAQARASELHEEKMAIINNMELTYEQKEPLLAPLEKERNKQLLLVETYESRILGLVTDRSKGIEQRPLPKF